MTPVPAPISLEPLAAVPSLSALGSIAPVAPGVVASFAAGCLAGAKAASVAGAVDSRLAGIGGGRSVSQRFILGAPSADELLVAVETGSLRRSRGRGHRR
jgi:hypothetical protein